MNFGFHPSVETFVQGFQCFIFLKLCGNLLPPILSVSVGLPHFKTSKDPEFFLREYLQRSNLVRQS